MLFSLSAISDDTVLDNANTLVHEWNPLDAAKHRLQIMDAGVIKVVPAQYSPTMNVVTLTTEPTSAGAAGQAAKPLPLSETLAQEKMILLWHFAQFKPLIEKQAKKINPQTVSDHQTCYQLSHTLQGVIQLLSAMKKQFSHFANQIDIFERNQTIKLDILGKLAQVQLQSDFIQMQNEANNLLDALKAKQKSLLTQIAFFMIVNDHEVSSFAIKLIPKSFHLAVNQSNHPELSIRAHWKISDCWSDFTQQPIAPMVMMNLFMGDTMIPINCLAYPCFQPSTGYQEITQVQVENGMYGINDYCKQFLNTHGEGLVPYQPRDLFMMLTGPFHIFNTEFLLLYTQLMVEIAELGDYNRVVFYAPYGFSYKACELGFHSDDNEFPNLEKQQQVVAENLRTRGTINIDASIDRYDLLTQEELLRPFYFDVREKGKRKVFHSDEGLTTTYAELMKDKKILEAETYPNGIFPEFGQAPKYPFRFSMKDLANREITGKLPNARVSCRQEKIDFHWLQDTKVLQQIGTASNDKESANNKHKTLLRLKPV